MERISYYDYLRGIAIICVIGIHVSNIGFSTENTLYYFTAIWKQIIHFAVPLFLTLSGFFLANKDVSNLQNHFIFLKKQIPRIIIPYLVWSILYFIFGKLQDQTILQLLIDILTFQINPIFYYIFLILQLYILLPILKRLANRKGLFFVGIINFLSILIISFIRNNKGIELPLLLYAGLFPTSFFYFVLGIYLKNNKISINNFSLLLSIIIMYLLQLLESYYLYSIYHEYNAATSASKITGFIYSILIVLFCFNQKQNEKLFLQKIFCALGRISYGIYLMHMLVIFVFIKFFSLYFSSIETYTHIYHVLLVFLISSSCYVISYFLKKTNLIDTFKYFGI